MDGNGIVTSTYDYRPYGKVLATSGTDASRFRFTGHERDAESGLDYMLARSYAYEVGRFLRPDPMQDEYPALSPYAYANNNPLKYVDPDGRFVFPALAVATEVVSTGYDAYNLYETIKDPKSTKTDVGMAVVGLGLGTALPGPGKAYVEGAKTLLTKARTLVRKVVNRGKRKGLTTPTEYFGKTTKKQLDRKLRRKFGEPRGGAPGGSSFYNKITGRTFHTHWHKFHRQGKPHVDMRKRGVKGTRRFDLKE